MDFIFNILLFFLKLGLPIVLVILLVFLVARWFRDLLLRIRERFVYGLHRMLGSLWNFVSLKWVWRFLRDLIDTIAGILGSFAKRVLIKLKEIVMEFQRVVFTRRAPAVRRKSKVLFRTSNEDAKTAVFRRKEYLRSVIGDDEALVRRELNELPPHFDDEIRSFDELGFLDSLIQKVTLRMQLENDSYALFGRVVDALVAILRQTGELSLTSTKRFTNGGSLDVSLKPLSEREFSEGQFPWVVVVGTNLPELVAEKLLTLKDWLGIGIDIARPLTVQPYWACGKSDDSNGTIAGLLRISSLNESNSHPTVSTTYALTCAHVAPKCDCHVIGEHNNNRDKEGRINGIDALLIPTNSKCLKLDTAEIDVLRTTRPSEIDTLAKPERHISGRKWNLVKRKGGESRALPGIILCPFACHTSVYQPTGESEFRAIPMAQVVLYQTKYFFGLIPWPMFRRYFSRPGDSGSWVLSENEESWVGMLTEGDKRAHLSYVLRAPELIEYLEMLVKCLGDSNWKNENQSLVPYLIKSRSK